MRAVWVSRAPPIVVKVVPDEEREKLRRMWETMGPAEIGRIVGRTPNSISGLAKRYGWPRKERYPAVRKTADRDYAERRVRAEKLAAKPRPKRTMKVVSVEVIPDHARPLMQHKTGECRFPYGQRFNIHYCCQPVFREGGSYCEGHSAICYDYDRMKKRAA